MLYFFSSFHPGLYSSIKVRHIFKAHLLHNLKCMICTISTITVDVVLFMTWKYLKFFYKIRAIVRNSRSSRKHSKYLKLYRISDIYESYVDIVLYLKLKIIHIKSRCISLCIYCVHSNIIRINTFIIYNN